jgi:transketolase
MHHGNTEDTETRALAKKIRIHALHMTSSGGGAHVGAAFSCADILAVLYGGVLNVRPSEPQWPGRDRLVVSKGHAASALYAVLAECGFLPVEELASFYQDGSRLCGHASHKVPGVELSTGALGHGLPMASGMAYAARLAGSGHRVFALLSDGECDEGSNWEAALFAGHHGLDNLVVIIDYNRIQGIAPISEVLELAPLDDKWRSFGWAVEQVDGHDHAALQERLRAVPFAKSKPSCLIAHTVKGKGVSFMEHTVLWHYRIPRGAEFEAALRELENRQ